MEILHNSSVSLISNFTTATSSEDDGSNLTFYVFDLGPKRDSLSSVIPITVVYMVLLVSGLIGNICTCVVIVRNRHMRSTTNYYLFSLAVSDLLLLVLGLPTELYQLWYRYPYVFGEAFCILRGLTSEMSTNASILTITAFTVERYLAICHPIRCHTMAKLSRAVKLIVVLWVIGGVCAVPMAVQFGVVVKEFHGVPVQDTAECTVKRPIENAFPSSTLCFFIIPMLIITALYALIGVQLHRSSAACGREQPPRTSGRQPSFRKLQLAKLLSQQSNSSIRGTGSSSRKAVIKMLLAVVIAFFLCWAPFHAQRLMAIYVRHQTPTAVMVYTVLTYISGVTYYVSATINPILYSIMSNKFRHAFKHTLQHCCRRNAFLEWNNASRNSTYRSSVVRPHNGHASSASWKRVQPPRRTDHVFRYKTVSNNNDVQSESKLEEQS